MSLINENITVDAQMIQTCVGAFYFGNDISDFVEFVHDVRSWDFNEGQDYDFVPLLFQPTDKKMYKFLANIMWDEMQQLAMFHLPYRFKNMFDELDVWSEWAIIERLLMLSGDVEMNPGPVQSRPLQYRNNDPRAAKLEKALERKDQKIKKLIKDLRHAIKRNKIYPQGLFDTLRESNSTVRESAGELNANLNRICDFLENNLPTIQTSVQATILNTADKFATIKDDLIKVTLICIIIRLMMVWKHYKTALAIVLLFILKFYGFDETVLNLVHELQQKFTTAQGLNHTAEEVIYHPYFHTCGKLIFAVLAFICIKKIPGKQDWDNYISRLDRIPKALQGSQKIIDFCSEYFNLATDQLKMMVLGKTREELARANGLYGEIHEWASEVRKYLDLEQRNKIDTDITIANKVEELYKRGVKFQQDTLLDRDMARLVSVTLLPARELYQYVSCSPVKGGGPRMRPICLWLIGESGVGKTEMVYPLCIDVLRTMGLMRKEDFHHQVYGRQVETEFWDGYKGQKIVIYDDAFQMKDDKTAPNPEIFEVIRSCNTFPQHLHMAALHDKNTFSAAELMIYTTNDANVKLESITFPEAFFNRIGEHAYKVRPKAEFAIETPRGNSGQTYRRLDKTKLNKDIPIDLSIYEFQKIIKDNGTDVQWTEIGEPIGYEAFAKLICDEWRHKKTESINKLKFLENYAIRAQVKPEEEEFFDCHNSTWFANDISRRICEGEDLITIENEYAADEKLFEEYLAFKNQRPKSIWDKYITRIDECLVKTGNFLKKLKEESCRIIQEHPYLSVLGFVGVALSAFAMYKWLENSMLETEAEVGHSGDPKTNRQQVRFVEVGGSGDAKTSRAQQKRVEVGVSGDSKTAKQNQKKVEVLDEQLLNKIETQGCNDLAAHSLITDVLQKNTYRLSYMRGGDRKPFGNCTFVRGWVFLMPYHFLQALYARKLAPETIIYFSQSKYPDIIQVPLSHIINIGVDGFTLTKNSVQLTHKNGDKRDCVLVNLHSRMCHPHRDLVKHFVKIEDQGKLQGKFNGTLATFHESGNELYRTYQWLQQIRPLDKPITIYLPENDGYEYKEQSYTQRDCYEYNAPTQVGDCGSIIGLYNHRMERKLIGIHIAGTNESYGYACPLTQEVIDDACEKMLGKDFKNISAQFYFETPKCVDTLSEPEVPEGLFCPLGKSDKKVGQAVKTSILPSRIHGKLSEPFMRPAILKPTRINGVLHDPLMKGLKKCGVETAVLTDEEVSSAVQDVSQVVLTQYNSMLDKKQYQRILTYEEAVAGVETDNMMNGVARKTSPGFPYNLQAKGFPGKTKWMGKEEKYDFDSMAAKQLRADVEELIEDCRNGKVSNVLFIDTLKDERRDNAKVDAGKTRVFSAGPQHFVVAFRKYFLPFAAWLMHNRIDNEVAVGTNPYSVDWERIAKRLKSKGKHVIAGDFGNFDGSLVAQILWAIFWEIFVPWLQQFNDLSTSEGVDVLKICLGLWTHLVHSVHIFGDNVYMWTHSQPSGNPFTVIINCLYNSSIMRVAWIRIMKKNNPQWMSMKWFRKFVAMIAYGDDNELNISEEVIDFFNQETISEIMKEMKHEYTDEAKSGNIVKSRLLEETFFLKRGFRFSPELQRTVAPLKIEVIYEMLNWTRNTIDPDVILMSNIETAFREIVYHGRDEYNKLRNGIMKLIDDLPAIPQILTYEQYLHDIEYLADEIYDF
ncbi:MAG: RNA helicase [Hangzhou hydrellia griseola dicistrovirus 1]|nr:MAG: RNA helicase [Hangzhou hydrellia griseola dicistrovirus 1]